MQSLFSKEMNKFEKIFYRKRKFLQNKPDIWLAYHTLYKNVVESIRELPSQFFILTTKDRYSVEMLATHFGFINQIENIFSKEISTNKSDLFKQFFNQYHYFANQYRIIFVDD